jgi:hypothetical protein
MVWRRRWALVYGSPARAEAWLEISVEE